MKYLGGGAALRQSFQHRGQSLLFAGAKGVNLCLYFGQEKGDVLGLSSWTLCAVQMGTEERVGE